MKNNYINDYGVEITTNNNGVLLTGYLTNDFTIEISFKSEGLAIKRLGLKNLRSVNLNQLSNYYFTTNAELSVNG